MTWSWLSVLGLQSDLIDCSHNISIHWLFSILVSDSTADSVSASVSDSAADLVCDAVSESAADLVSDSVCHSASVLICCQFPSHHILLCGAGGGGLAPLPPKIFFVFNIFFVG